MTPDPSIVALLLLAITCSASPQSSPPLEESAGATAKLGYTTVAAALEGLRSKPGVSMSTQPDGWVVAVDQGAKAVWSFTPAGHYAYPAVVRREVKQREGGAVYVETVALCQAAKEPCDKLIREFQQLNEQVGPDARRGSPGQQR